MARITFGSLEVGDTVFYLQDELPYTVIIREGIVTAKGRIKDGIVRMKIKIDGKTLRCSPFADSERSFIPNSKGHVGGIYIASNREEFVSIAKCALIERMTLRDYHAQSVDLLLQYVSDYQVELKWKST